MNAGNLIFLVLIVGGAAAMFSDAPRRPRPRRNRWRRRLFATKPAALPGKLAGPVVAFWRKCDGGVDPGRAMPHR